MFVVTGLLAALAGVAGYAIHTVRDAEKILPDYDQAVAPSADAVSARVQKLLDAREQLRSEPDSLGRTFALEQIEMELRDLETAAQVGLAD
jgi:hypothetical protein